MAVTNRESSYRDKAFHYTIITLAAAVSIYGCLQKGALPLYGILAGAGFLSLSFIPNLKRTFCPSRTLYAPTNVFTRDDAPNQQVQGL